MTVEPPLEGSCTRTLLIQKLPGITQATNSFEFDEIRKQTREVRVTVAWSRPSSVSPIAARSGQPFKTVCPYNTNEAKDDTSRI